MSEAVVQSCSTAEEIDFRGTWLVFSAEIL